MTGFIEDSITVESSFSTRSRIMTVDLLMPNVDGQAAAGYGRRSCSEWLVALPTQDHADKLSRRSYLGRHEYHFSAAPIPAGLEEEQELGEDVGCSALTDALV